MPMRLLGALTLIFAGSFAATAITFGWPENLAPATASARTPVHLAASTPTPAQREHR